MRYSRQEIFLGKKAQNRLNNTTVVIVGLGSLGTTTSELLARAGVNLILIDRDLVELSNLQTQLLYDESCMNKPKVLAAKEKLEKINSQIKITSNFTNLDHENVNLLNSDLILDCTDNLETRFLINEFSVKNNTPFIYASAIKDSGFIFNIISKPCLKCVLKNSKTTETCETSGVLNTTSTLISSIQVNEAIKILVNNNPEKDLIHVNLKNNTINKIKVKPDENCPVCNKNFEYLEGKKVNLNKYCNTFIFKEKFNYNIVKNNLKKLGAKEFQNVIVYKKITAFPNSILIKTNSKKEANSLYSKYIGN